MKRICVIDGQGGGIGSTVIKVDARIENHLRRLIGSTD
jgi:hypothetical protein